MPTSQITQFLLLSILNINTWTLGNALNSDCDNINNSSWTLVRHAYNSWHLATDDCAGTESYNETLIDDNPLSLNIWSKTWNNSNVEQYMFSNGDCSEYLITTFDQFKMTGGSGRANYLARIEQSHFSATPYNARWYSRPYQTVDPWISYRDHDSGDGQCYSCLYGENNYGTGGRDGPHRGRFHNENCTLYMKSFINVWVKYKPQSNESIVSSTSAVQTNAIPNECYCNTYNKTISNLLTRPLKSQCYTMDGTRWTLVRHSYNSWHSATDNCLGSESYGNQWFDNNPLSLFAWSKTWNQYNVRRYMFSNGDCSEYLITTASQFAINFNDEYYNALIEKSHISSSAYYAKWYVRDNKSADPWISYRDHNESECYSCLYGENNFDNTYGQRFDINEENCTQFMSSFINVWVDIIKPTTSPTKKETPSPTVFPTSSPDDGESPDDAPTFGMIIGVGFIVHVAMLLWM